VALKKVLTICQLYHTLNSPPPSIFFIPIPGIFSKSLVFPFTYMSTQYLHYIHPPTQKGVCFLEKVDHCNYFSNTVLKITIETNSSTDR
jgi:hypothetical protein